MGRGRRDYEVFDLSKLDDPPLLKRFYMILAEPNLLGSLTPSLLQRSLKEDKDITVALYRDYNSLRMTLIDVVQAEHPNAEPDEVIRLAQKLLDRVLFIAFAEDTVLLPDNQLRLAVSFSNPYEPKPKWSYLKRLFSAVDKGNPRLDKIVLGTPLQGGFRSRRPLCLLLRTWSAYPKARWPARIHKLLYFFSLKLRRTTAPVFNRRDRDRNGCRFRRFASL